MFKPRTRSAVRSGSFAYKLKELKLLRRPDIKRVLGFDEAQYDALMDARVELTESQFAELALAAGKSLQELIELTGVDKPSPPEVQAMCEQIRQMIQRCVEVTAEIRSNNPEFRHKE